MKVFRDENGQMLVFTALTMTVLLGFLALATDVGTLFRARRQLQIATDAAATAAALDILNNNTNTQATTDAYSAAATNGAPKGNGTTITVTIAPTTGFHTGAGYVAVAITQPNPTFFMRLFGRNSMNIGAYAVAGTPGYATNCIYLDDTKDYDFKVQGSFTLNSPGCGVYVNSYNTNSVLSASGAGGALTIDAPYVATVGGGPSSLGGSPIYTNSAPESPPNLQSTGFTPSDCTSTNPTAVSSTINGGGGVVCFTGSNVDMSGLTLQNGVFLFENGVSVGVSAATTINDATLEVYGGSYTQNSNSILNVIAPQPSNKTCLSCVDVFCGSGSNNCLNFNAVGLLVPTANLTYTNAPCASSSPGNGTGTLQVQFGSNNQYFDGYIVAPNADVYLQDNGGGTTYSGIYAACMFGKSSTVNIPSYNVEHPSTTPLRTVALVE